MRLQASDGLFTYVTDQKAVDIVGEVLEGASDMRTAAKAAAKRLTEVAIKNGSKDDISVIVNAYKWTG